MLPIVAAISCDSFAVCFRSLEPERFLPTIAMVDKQSFRAVGRMRRTTTARVLAHIAPHMIAILRVVSSCRAAIHFRSRFCLSVLACGYARARQTRTRTHRIRLLHALVSVQLEVAHCSSRERVLPYRTQISLKLGMIRFERLIVLVPHSCWRGYSAAFSKLGRLCASPCTLL